MAIEKKSLIAKRAAVKKAAVAGNANKSKPRFTTANPKRAVVVGREGTVDKAGLISNLSGDPTQQGRAQVRLFCFIYHNRAARRPTKILALRSTFGESRQCDASQGYRGTRTLPGSTC